MTFRGQRGKRNEAWWSSGAGTKEWSRDLRHW